MTIKLVPFTSCSTQLAVTLQGERVKGFNVQDLLSSLRTSDDDINMFTEIFRLKCSKNQAVEDI